MEIAVLEEPHNNYAVTAYITILIYVCRHTQLPVRRPPQLPVYRPQELKVVQIFELPHKPRTITQ